MLLKRTLLNKPLKISHPVYQQLSMLFEEVNKLLHLIDNQVDTLNEKVAIDFFMPMVRDLNDLVGVIGIHIEGMKSQKGSLLLQQNEAEVEETVSLVKESFDQIKAQYYCLVKDTEEA